MRVYSPTQMNAENSESCLLSVVLPVFNTENYVEECLSSLIAATEEKQIPSEILAIDDGSTDGSMEIVRRFAAQHPSIRVMTVDAQTRGPGHARNIAIEQASGEFITFADSDDLVAHDIYERMLASLQHFQSDICMCDAARLKKGRPAISVAHIRAFSNVVLPVTTLEESPSLLFGAFVWNLVMRRSLLMDNGLHFAENIDYEDMLFCPMVLSKASRISFVRDAKYLWRIRDVEKNSVTQSNNKEQNFLDWTEIQKRVLQYVRESVGSPAVIKTLITKILMLFPVSMIADAGYLDDHALLKRVQIMKAFAEEHIPEDAYRFLPIILEQFWINILSEDIREIRRCVTYRKLNYNRIPLIPCGDHFEIVPNTSVITTARRDVACDYTFKIPVCHLRSAFFPGSSLRLFGWLYFQRISVPEVGIQHVRAFLYNDDTGEKIRLHTTETYLSGMDPLRSATVNYDDYTTYYYDYRGCGFLIDMDLDNLLEELTPGNYLIMLDYEHPLKQGTRILRGIHPLAIADLNGVSRETESRKLQISVDSRQTLQLKISKKNAQPQLRDETPESVT